MEMILVFVVILICTNLISWHCGKHHELNKINTQFENVLKNLGPSSRFRQGLQLAKQIIDTMSLNFRGNYVEKH